MGLDIYVGPLSRYYSGQWLTILQQVGIAQGMPVQVIRSQQPRSFWSRITSRFVGRQPAHRIDAIVAWRDDLASRGLFHPAIEWEWPESLDIAYETDKPSVTGWGAVQLGGIRGTASLRAPFRIARRLGSESSAASRNSLRSNLPSRTLAARGVRSDLRGR